MPHLGHHSIKETIRDFLLEVDAFIVSYVLLSQISEFNQFTPKLTRNLLTNLQGVAIFAIAMLAISFAIYYILRRWLKNRPLTKQISLYVIVFVILVVYITYTLSA